MPEIIETEHVHHTCDFAALVPEFKRRLEEWNPKANNFSIEQMFGPGIRDGRALKILFENGVISKREDFKGIYLFLKSGSPFYVGISRKVIARLVQHVKSSSHHSASLCYNIGSDLYLLENGAPHKGRKNLPLEFLSRSQKELLKCNVAFLPVTDDLELYIFEAHVAMELGTLKYNKFRTH